jgi:regulator of sirC expression with transglutaminase-like and TPR domain
MYNFYAEIDQPDSEINLAKAALLIAQEEYPDLEIGAYLHAIDMMAVEARGLTIDEEYPLRIIQCLNEYFYDELGFVGNTKNYYDPGNSFLNQVIDRKTGIPITLSLIYLEVSQRLDFPMIGINLPGHFLIRPEFEDTGIFIDPFNRGEILFEQDCEERLAKLYGRIMPMPAEFLQPITKRQFLVRLLTNLKFIYLNQRELKKALKSVEYILLLFPDAVSERRDRGLLYFQLGLGYKAVQDLEIYLAMRPNAEDANTILQLLEQLRREA